MVAVRLRVMAVEPDQIDDFPVFTVRSALDEEPCLPVHGFARGVGAAVVAVTLVLPYLFKGKAGRRKSVGGCAGGNSRAGNVQQRTGDQAFADPCVVVILSNSADLLHSPAVRDFGFHHAVSKGDGLATYCKRSGQAGERAAVFPK